MKNLKIAVIGVGNMGKSHAERLYGGFVPNATLSAVCDVDPARLEFSKEQYPGVLLYDNYEKLLADKVCDAVIIATPHYFHPIIAMAALKAGYHVLSEKPVGVYTKNIEELNALAEKSGKVFAVMFNQRTTPAHIKAKEIVESGQLGELKRVQYVITDWYRTQAYYDSGSWRATWSGEGGGVLINQCPHNLDLLQWICGMPVKIRAFCKFGQYRNIEVEDNVTAYMEFENGATGIFMSTTAELPGINRFEIMGDKGKLVIEKFRGQKKQFLTFYKLSISEKEYNKIAVKGYTIPEYTVEEYSYDDIVKPHTLIIINFVNAILKGEPLIAKGQEGIKSLTLSNAMKLSTFIDNWVEFPIDADLYLSELNKRIEESKAKEPKKVRKMVADIEGTY